MPDSLIDRIRLNQPELSAIRRDIHAHPEMELEEVRTAALVAAKLREWGVEVTEGVGGTGVVGTIRGKLPGQRAIGLRADMDHGGDGRTIRLDHHRHDARLRP
jgi:hippurate hydrolase